jgi:hypothetical protein
MKFHPLIYTLLEITLVRNVVVCQRFSGLGSNPHKQDTLFQLA